jgi:hypothetical protein
MKLLGRDIPARELISRIEERLRMRGLVTSEAVEVPAEGVEPRVEPLTFNLHALEENADATRALPLHTHRGGAGQLVLVAKWAFRKSCQVFINEALGRQRVFNGHVRDSYAQLSAEVIRLRREVEQLRARGGGMPPEDDRRPIPAKTDGASAPKPPAAQPSATAKPVPESRSRPTERPPAPGKAAPRAKPATARKSKPAASTAPATATEPVLPQPRQARAGAGQTNTPRPRPEATGPAASSTEQPGSRPRPSGTSRPRRRRNR